MRRPLCVLPLLLPVILAPAPSTAQVEAPAYPRLRIGGFTDFNFFASDEKGSPDPTSGFQEGQFILHFSSALSERVGFFSEVSLTPKADEFKAEVERTIIRFSASNHLAVSMGRYHNPVSWWNVAFHHGQWLQTTVSRPEMIRFGGLLVPVHFVGALIEGTIPVAGFDFLYRAGIGNGRDTKIGRAGDAGDANNNRAWLGTLAVRPDALYGLEVGGGYYRDRVPLDADASSRESIRSAWVAWKKERPEVIAEFAHVEHDDPAGGDPLASNGGYVQIAYRLQFAERVKPYARYEEMAILSTDPAFKGPAFETSPPDLVRYLAGVRFELSDFAALKVEGRRDREGGKDEVNSIHGQVSVAF